MSFIIMYIGIGALGVATVLLIFVTVYMVIDDLFLCKRFDNLIKKNIDRNCKKLENEIKEHIKKIRSRQHE